MSEPGALMAAEIDEQPEMLALLIERRDEIERVRAAVRDRAPRFVVLAARGTSDHAALYAKYLIEVELGLPAGLTSPSTMTVYDAHPTLDGVLFVAVSQSGGSSDLVNSLTTARACGALTVAVTNAPESALAEAADLHVNIRAGTERAVAATKTYTAELLALHLLLVGADGTPGLPDAAAATLRENGADRMGELAQRYRFAERLITTARGFSYPTAREAALKLMETSYLSAQAFSAADLLHGPFAMIDSGVPVIAIASPGRGGDALAAALDRLDDTGADVVRVGPPGPVPVSYGKVPERLAPVLEILPLQRLARQVALDRGIDPDRPRGLTKVTDTH
jgi:glutamine---fructose-6-phosphate transaminase (isomerizing)